MTAAIAKHKPDILGLGEANFKPGHDIVECQQDGYTLHLGPGLESLGVARVAAYIKDGLLVKRRRDLEGGKLCTLWLQVGLPNKPAALVMFGYRQWQLPGSVEGSGSVAAQLERWLVILEQWERALEENRETICMMDANIDLLTWTTEDLPRQHSSSKLRPLTQALFARILPQGVSQLVTCATRAERGVPVTGLDHLYTPFSLPCRAGAARLIGRQWMTSLDLCLPSGQGSQPWRRQPALAGLASPRHCRREPKGH